MRAKIIMLPMSLTHYTKHQEYVDHQRQKKKQYLAWLSRFFPSVHLNIKTTHFHLVI